MSASTLSPPCDDARLPSDIGGLDWISRPIWVLDLTAQRLIYANPSAIALWGASNLADLRARDFTAPSKAARTRRAQTYRSVLAGQPKNDIWTVYPKGEPVSVKTVSSHLPLRDGSSAILVEAALIEEPADYLRALEAVRQLQTLVSLYDADGRELFGNPGADDAYGCRRRLTERCEDPDAAREAWTLAIETGRFRGRLMMRTEQGVFAHDLTLQKTVDPITGAAAILSYESDDTEKLATEERLHDQALALQEARMTADAANDAKSVFLANMSHEIRTPLNGVISLADVLCQSALTGSQREAAELIRESGRSLERLLAEILQLAQIEAGEIAIADEPFDLAAVGRTVTDLMRLKAEASGVALELRISLPRGHGRSGDPLRIRQILTNLTSNAIKFTQKGSVLVVIEEYGDGVRILVEDTGIGFTKHQKTHIFERFQQADGSITRRFGGNGLGLAITAELVGLMGGQIGCDSTVGVGSCFWADLPLAVAPLAASPESETRDDADLVGLQVLVADDHAVNRRVLEMILEPLGAEVVSVENGAEAVEAVDQADFDVVLMDMQMPVMDGLEATRAISAANGPPVIIVSANGMPEHVEAARNAGAIAHVTKPIEPANLIETVCATVVDARAASAIDEASDARPAAA